MGQILSQANEGNKLDYVQKHINSQYFKRLDNNFSRIYTKNNEISFTELAKEFEKSRKEVINRLGLFELARNIRDAALVLKNLDFTDISIFSEQVHPDCFRDYRLNGLDFCDKNEKYPVIDISCPTYCSKKVKTKESYDMCNIKTENSNDELMTKLHDATLFETINCNSKMKQEIDKQTRVLRHFRESELRECPCGCRKIIEIVDKSEKKRLKLAELCCEWTDDMTGCDRLQTLSKRLTNITNEPGNELLQMKYKLKDGLNGIFGEELQNPENVSDIIKNNIPPHIRLASYNFDKSLLYKYLTTRSYPELNQDKKFIRNNIVPAPKNFRIVRIIFNSFHLAWDHPDNLHNIRGYEILINGIVASRVRSVTRSQAILTCANTKRPTIFVIYSIAVGGYISEPLTITFPNPECN